MLDFLKPTLHNTKLVVQTGALESSSGASRPTLSMLRPLLVTTLLVVRAVPWQLTTRSKPLLIPAQHPS